ncbi:ribonuclease H-like domain-containing protein [Tanacetum coccineum]
MAISKPSGAAVSINGLDAGNPLHVQNSDYTNSVIIPFKLLGTEKYRIWSDAVKLALQARNKYVFIDGTCLKETYASSDVLSAQWDRCNAIVLTWIMNVGGSLVADYYHRLNALWREFNALTKLPNNNNFTRGSTSNVNRVPIPNLSCKHYGKTGKQTFNANVDITMNDKSYALSFSSFTPEKMQKLLSMINDKPSGSIHTNMVGRASFFNGNVWFNINFNKYVFANSSLSITTISMGWIIDSGANQYLTVSTVGMYNVVDISELKITGGHPNRTLATISHVRNLKLTNNVVLYDVLVVPGYCVSLLSVNKLIRDSKMFVGFDKNKFYIQDLKSKKVLRISSESGGPYLFEMNNSNCIGKSNMVLSFHVSKLLWHNRVGHPADQVPSVLKNDLSISDNTFVPMCKVCQRAKQTREPFPLSDHKFKTLSELVHLNLWGGIPLRFWSDCVLTDVYLINKLPSSVLNGKIKRYKAGLVVKGFSQREDFDYDETFIPVVKMVTVRRIISLAVVNNWPLFKLDVNNAFLYDDLVEDVYMTLPDGYNNEDKSKVSKLNKSLYGLKQAPRQWNAKLTNALAEHGFEQSKFDYSLYTKHNGDKFVALLVYVDDNVITGNDDYLLGIEVIENNLSLYMSQRKYCLELLHEYGLLAARPVDIPLSENSILHFKETKDDKYLSDFTTYQNKKQATISKSSSEVEYRSMSFASSKVVWLGELVGKDLGRKNYSRKKKDQAHQPEGRC